MKTVKEILEAYNDNYMSKYDPRFGKKFPPEKEIPAVIVLKRKAIRVYPDSQKIALYYSSQLDKYVSIPYGPGTQSSIQISESKATQFDPEVTDAEKEAFKKTYDKNRKITSKDIRKKLPIGTIARVQGAGSAAKEAISRGLEHGDIPYTMGNLTGIAGVAAARGVAKGVGAAYRGVKKLLKKEDIDVNENFKSKLKDIREARSYGKADAALDAASFLPGPAGSAASLASAGMSLSRGDIAGAALDVAGALPGVGYLAKGAKVAKTIKGASKATKVAKGSKAAKTAKGGKGKGLLGLATGAGLGAALGGGGGGGGGDESSVDYARRRAKELSTPSSKAQFSDPGSYLATNRYSGAQEYSTDARYQFDQRKATTIGMGKRQTTQQESTNFDKIKMIAENNIKTDCVTFGDNSITINNRIAKKLINVYESLNKDNRKKVEEMINEDVNSFKKLINFAIRQ